jgi:hypothetical protein
VVVTAPHKQLIHITRDPGPAAPRRLCAPQDRQLRWCARDGRMLDEEGRALDSEAVLALLFESDGVLIW